MEEENKKRLRQWKPSKKMLAASAEAKLHLSGSDEEFDAAFKIIDKYPKRVTMFGSARTTESGEVYRKAAYDIAYALAKEDFAIVTGGGGGIMSASNQGAYDAGGVSIGFNIQLPHEQHLNPYITESLGFHYFFTRKVMMTFFAHAYVYFPGGFGTMDELFELITLIQTHKMPQIRIVLFGSDFWNDMDKFIREHMLQGGLISEGDEQLYYITDDVEEAVGLITHIQVVGLSN